MITDQFINNKHVLITYIGSVESFDENIDVVTNTRKIINGKTSLLNLKSGIVIESIIQDGVDKGVIPINSSFASCFADCVFALVANMSWLERALCLIDIELCLPGVTIGCTINCTVNS